MNDVLQKFKKGENAPNCRIGPLCTDILLITENENCKNLLFLTILLELTGKKDHADCASGTTLAALGFKKNVFREDKVVTAQDKGADLLMLLIVIEILQIYCCVDKGTCQLRTSTREKNQMICLQVLGLCLASCPRVSARCHWVGTERNDEWYMRISGLFWRRC